MWSKLTERKYSLILAGAVLMVSSPALAADGSIKLKTVAETEVLTVQEDGSQDVARVRADVVTPGDEVIYTIFFENSGADPAEDVVIVNPVPLHMTCLDVPRPREPVEITFSVDGGDSFDLAENLKVQDNEGNERPMELGDCTHIRWTFVEALPPGVAGQVSFRAALQ